MRRDLGAIKPRPEEIVSRPAGEHESFRLRSEPRQCLNAPHRLSWRSYVGSRRSARRHRNLGMRDGELAQSQDADPETHGHDGSAHAGRLCRLRRTGLSHARRRPLLHGPEGSHRPRQISRRVGNDAVLHRGAEAASCKWVSIRERNREKYDLPTVFSILIYTHPETGFPLAICDGSYHTVMRTGAAAAVSAKWMARKNSKRLAIVGAGHMAEGTLATCNEVFAWEEVRVWSRTQATLDHFIATQQLKFPKLKLKASTTLPEVVSCADVVVTVTPARGAIVMNEWITAGTHIAALGADKGGDQELDPKILQRARIFVDDI